MIFALICSPLYLFYSFSFKFLLRRRVTSLPFHTKCLRTQVDEMLMNISVFRSGDDTETCLTSTAALALSNSSSRDWFLDRSVLPNLWSLPKRPCQTHVHNKTRSAISLTREKALPLPTPHAGGKEKCQNQQRRVFFFLSPSLLCVSLSLIRGVVVHT